MVIYEKVFVTDSTQPPANYLPDNTLIYESLYTLGKYYVGGYNHTGSIFIGLNPEEYEDPEKEPEGITGIKLFINDLYPLPRSKLRYHQLLHLVHSPFMLGII
jgi:hypothetical protein